MMGRKELRSTDEHGANRSLLSAQRRERSSAQDTFSMVSVGLCVCMYVEYISCIRLRSGGETVRDISDNRECEWWGVRPREYFDTMPIFTPYQTLPDRTGSGAHIMNTLKQGRYVRTYFLTFIRDRVRESLRPSCMNNTTQYETGIEGDGKVA